MTSLPGARSASLDPIPADITLGKLDATASVPGIFAYFPAARAVLNLGVQTLSVTFTPFDTEHYTSATAETQINVNSPAPPPAPPHVTGIISLTHSK